MNPPIDNDIVIGKTDSLYSDLLGEQRKFWVYIPNSFHFSRYTAQKQYPVAYLLDGDVHFLSFCGMVEHLSEENNNHICPDMIVVGILNTNRTRDMTPDTDTAMQQPTGGGKKFADFLQNELMPYINKRYHPAPYNLLIGHSYAGLEALHILADRPGLFKSVVAIDPSLSWNKAAGKKYLTEKLAANKLHGQSLFIGIANTMNCDMPLKQLMADTSSENAHMRANLEFVELLRRQHLPDLRWDYNYYDDEDHSSVTIRALYDGLHFIFREYPFVAGATLLDTATSAVAACSMLHLHFLNMSAQMGYSVYPPEKLVDGFAEQAMQLGQNGKALALLKMNQANYPGAASVYLKLAAYFRKQGNTDSAMCYQKLAGKPVARQ
jgi:hypothetical protein